MMVNWLLCDPRVSSTIGGLFPGPDPEENPSNNCLGSGILGAAPSEFFWIHGVGLGGEWRKDDLQIEGGKKELP